MIEPIGLPVVLHQWCIVGFVVLWFAWRWNSAWKIAMSCTLGSCSAVQAARLYERRMPAATRRSYNWGYHPRDDAAANT